MFENKIQTKKKRFKHLKQESNFVQTLLFSYLFVLRRKNTPNEEYILYYK